MASPISSAERGISDLNIAAAHSSLSKDEFITAVNKLTQVDLVDVDNIRSSFTVNELLHHGLTENEITGLEPILQRTSMGNEVAFFSATVPDILFVFSIVRYRMEEFLEKDHKKVWFQRIGVMLCETFCDPAASEKAAEFLSEDLLHKGRSVLFSILGKQIANDSEGQLLRIHMISSCGEYKKSIVPVHIEEVRLSGISLTTNDATAVGDVLSCASHIGKLDLFNSGLNANSLNQWAVSLGNSDVKIAELKVSWNKNIGVEGAGIVGDIVKKHSVNTLSMENCGLRYKHLKSFMEHCGEAKISELNVSYNDAMDVTGAGCVGDIVKKCSVDKLRMRGCELRYRHLKSFNERSGEAKITELDVSINLNLDVEGFGCVGDIVKKHLVEKLSISGKDRLYKGINSFIEHAGEAKIHEIAMDMNSKSFNEFLLSLHRLAKVTKAVNLVSKVPESDKILLQLYRTLTGLEVKYRNKHLTQDDHVTACRLLQCKLLESQGQQLLNAFLVASFCVKHLQIICPPRVPICNLAGAEICMDNAQALVKVFHHVTHIQELHLIDCQLKPDAVRILSDGFPESLKIAELDISDNAEMGMEGAGYVGNIVTKHSVEKLSMQKCGLQYENLYSFNKHSEGAAITELDVSNNLSMNVEGAGCVGDIVKKHSTKKLFMKNCGLQSEHLKSFNEHSEATIDELDISDNSVMGMEGAGCVGDIVKKHSTKKLIMKNCGLQYEHLKSFNEHSEEAKISELDISENCNLGVKGAGCVGDIVNTHMVEKLSMQKCGLECEHLESFNDQSGEAKIAELDISYNAGMGVDGAGCVGDIVGRHSVEKLSMQKCGLQYEHLDSFNKRLGEAKIVELDISDNFGMSLEGAGCVGDIIKKHSGQKLLMRNCGLQYEHLRSFYEHSVKAKIGELDVSSNPNIGVQGAGCLGDIVKNRSVQKLSVQICRLQHEHLDSFSEHLGEAKVAELDASRNIMEVDAAGSLGDIVRKHSVKKLSLKGFEFLYKHVDLFIERVGAAKICELAMDIDLKPYNRRFHLLLRLLPTVSKSLNLNFTLNENETSLTRIYAALTGLEVFLGSKNLIQGNYMAAETACQLLKETLLESHGQQLLAALLVTSLCEGHMQIICPTRVPIFNLTGAEISTTDAHALVRVFSHITHIQELRLAACQLKAKTIHVLRDGLVKSLEISVLDISRNNTIGISGAGFVGDIVNNHSVGGLKMSDCGLSCKQLASLLNHLKDAKISRLDLSGNENMEVDGLGVVGDLVLNCKVDSLSLAICGLNFERLQAFNKHAIDCKISVLDVSGNESLGVQGAQILGHIVTLKCVNKLVLNCCGLTYEHLFYFDEQSGESVIYELDLSWNVGMGTKAVGFIGNIVSNHSVKKLTMQYCRLTSEEVESLSANLENTKMKELDLSSQTLPEDHDYEFPTKEVCSLLNVVDILDVSGNKLDETDKSLLQYHLDHHELHNVRIFVDDSELRSNAPSTIRHEDIKKEYLRDFKGPFMTRILKSTGKRIFEEKMSEDDSAEPEPRVKGEQFEITATDPFPTTRIQEGQSEASTSGQSEDTSSLHYDPFPMTQMLQARIGSSIPSITCTKEIGPEGGRITVGGCFIEFQPGTFTKFRKLTLTGRIDSSEWPEREVISPTLGIKLRKIPKPAKVRLSTWVTPTDEPYPDIDIFHSTDNGWEIIHTQQLGLSGFIEFQCDCFCSVLATLRTYGRMAAGLFLPISITFSPTLFIYRDRAVVAFHVDDQILSNHVRKCITSSFEDKPDDILRCPLPFLKGDNVDIRLEFSSRSSGFSFEPDELLNQIINQWSLAGNVHYKYYTIESGQKAKSVTIVLKVGKRGSEMESNSLPYYWNPDYKESTKQQLPDYKESTKQQLPDYKRSTKRHSARYAQLNPTKRRKLTSSSTAIRLESRDEDDAQASASCSSNSWYSRSPKLDHSPSFFQSESETDGSQSPKSQNIIFKGGVCNIYGNVSQGTTEQKEDFRNAKIQNLNKGRQHTSNKDSKSSMKVEERSNPT